jgi:hypothetical protein
MRLVLQGAHPKTKLGDVGKAFAHEERAVVQRHGTVNFVDTRPTPANIAPGASRDLIVTGEKSERTPHV